jgi:WD40 repeat protein
VIPCRQGIPGYFAFSPDGKTLAVTHSRTRVRLIDPITGLEQATLQAPDEHEVTWICFGPDGSRLAVAYTNGLIHAWDLRLIRAQLASRGLNWESN